MSNEREQKLTALAQGVGTDIKTIRAVIGALTLASLTVPGAGSLIEAANINRSAIETLQNAPPSYTNEQALTVATNLINSRQGTIASPDASQYATTQGVVDALNAATDSLRTEILGSMPSEALNTIQELAAALEGNDNVLTNLMSALGTRVDAAAAQSFTLEQRRQASQNIGMGDPEYDFLADYVAARDAV